MTVAQYSKIVTPYSTSDMNAVCDAARAHCHDLHDTFFTIAAEMRVSLARLEGRPGLLGIDSKLAAARVTRNLVHAGACELEAAKAWAQAWIQFQNSFISPKLDSKRGFRIDK